jgi:hypothetical protein
MISVTLQLEIFFIECVGKNRLLVLFYKFEVALYPNPVASGSVLNWDTEIDYNYLTIIDLSGQVVFSTNVIDKSLTVPILGSGYYFIQFNNTFSKVSKSLVIE